MSDSVQRINCGDMEHCKQCSMINQKGTQANGYAKSMVLNAQDRCDFYDGPDKIIFNTAIP